MTPQDLLAELKKFEREGYKIGYRQGIVGSFQNNTLMDGWDFMIVKGNAARQLGLYFNPRTVYLSFAGEDFDKVELRMDFSPQGDVQLMAEVAVAIFGVLKSSSDLIIHGTEDEITNEFMQSIDNAVSEKLAEHGVTARSYGARGYGNLFFSGPEAA